jgi:hypothetical protein
VTKVYFLSQRGKLYNIEVNKHLMLNYENYCQIMGLKLSSIWIECYTVMSAKYICLWNTATPIDDNNYLV